MTIQVTAENEIIREVAQTLLQHLTPTKVARFWASWHIGQGDYLEWRDEQFANETVDSLCNAILDFQDMSSQPK